MDAADLEARQAAFGAVRGLFDALVDELGDPAADELTHVQLEERIATRGREVMRQMLQDHLDLWSIREPRRSEVTGSDRVAHRRIEPGHERALATVFGVVAVTRIAHRALGASNLHPMDAGLNLPVERASFGLRRLAAIEAVRGSIDDAKAAIERATGTRIGKRQVEQLAERAAADIEALYRAVPPAVCTDERLLVASVDGIANGDFEPYYAWHLHREHQRTHQARYQDKLSLAAEPRQSLNESHTHSATARPSHGDHDDSLPVRAIILIFVIVHR